MGNFWNFKIGLFSAQLESKRFQCSSVTQSCRTLCNPMNRSTPGHPVQHQLLEATQTHVSDDIQPSYPLLSPFSCLQSFPASGSHWKISQFLASSGQNIGASASTSVLPMNIQDWFPSGWTGWISLQFKGLSMVFYNCGLKTSVLQSSAYFIVQLSHPYITTGKNITLTRWTFVGKVMSLLFNMLSRLVIDFVPRNKCLLISWLQSRSAVILEPPKIKYLTVSPSISHEVMGPDAMILVFWILNFGPTFSLSSFCHIEHLLY